MRTIATVSLAAAMAAGTSFITTSSLSFSDDISGLVPNAGVRAYVSIPFGGAPEDKSAAPRLGLQLYGNLTNPDDVDLTLLSDQQPLLDFGLTQDGIGKLDVLGADMIPLYDGAADKQEFIGSIATSMLTTAAMLIAIPVGAAIYCDATNCVDRLRGRAEDELRQQAHDRVDAAFE